MERFQLPEQLPATVEELNELRTAALAHIQLIQARVSVGEQLSEDDLAYLRGLLDARDTITAEITNLEQAEVQHRQDLAELLARASETPAADAEAAEGDAGEAPAEQTPEAETQPPASHEAEVESAEPELVEVGASRTPVPVAASGDPRPVNFSGLDTNEPPRNPSGPGWLMRPDAPGYVSGPVGFSHIGKALDGQIKGSRKMGGRSPQPRGSHMAQVIASLGRNAPPVSNEHDLYEAIENATTTVPSGRGASERVPVTANSLVAAGGWCSPSETLYDFCDVPAATDLISVPEITIVRGGVRWPVEPDLSAIFNNFEFYFTETELEGTDANGVPIAVKECIEIPCPTEFEEMRLNVVGYCVEAGILQTQGWPELITWFMQQLVAEHLRAISRRTILDMVQGSTAETFSSTYLIGTAGAVINSVSLMATNLRLNRGLGRNAAIEAVAPSWLLEVIRSDVAYYHGLSSKAVTDAEIHSWFAHRDISLQLVGDWQTRGTGQPGALNTVTWPSSVDVLLYPAGTWFRAMQNVIDLGVMYPKEELVLNRYTRMFTEDAIAVASRCYPSVVATIPINVSGAWGAETTLTPPSYTRSAGALFSGAPVPGGPSDYTQGDTYSIAISGSPTGGSFVLGLTPTGGSTVDSTAIPENAYDWQVAQALEGLLGLTSDDFYVSHTTAGVQGENADGTPGIVGQLPTDVLSVTLPFGTALSVVSNATGGTVTVTKTATGTGT